MNIFPFSMVLKHSARLGAVAISLAYLVHAHAQPFIFSTVPANGASGVSPSASVVFTFSEQMDTVATTAEFRDSMTFALLPVSSVWSGANNVLTCTPTPAFPSAGFIVWIVEGENLPGDPIEGETSGFFMTSGGGGGTGSGTNQITAFTVGKVHFYNQTSAGAPTLDVDVPYNFTATTVLASNRAANSVTVTLPTSAVSNLTQNILQPESFYLFSTWTDLPSFNANFPAGNYVFNVVAATSNQLVTVNLPESFAQPNAPHTTS
ncbi:MAG TPA: Ig-like domain-containing protein, partial [Candidatus Limnocylindria bacterium]|nr:Ig-like domain-containing protein [Candidatus Limnocylindria bacterium]